MNELSDVFGESLLRVETSSNAMKLVPPYFKAIL